MVTRYASHATRFCDAGSANPNQGSVYGDGETYYYYYYYSTTTTTTTTTTSTTSTTTTTATTTATTTYYYSDYYLLPQLLLLTSSTCTPKSRSAAVSRAYEAKARVQNCTTETDVMRSSSTLKSSAFIIVLPGASTRSEIGGFGRRLARAPEGLWLGAQ